jgi:hypothetical protein
MTARCLFTALLLCLSLACRSADKVENSAKPSPSPSAEDSKARVAREEAKSQGNDYFDRSRTAVREAASQFVKTELPAWTLKGMASEPFESNVFWVDVDLENGQHKRVLSLVVKQFFPESGKPYWKAFPLDKSHASQLHDARDSRIEAELEGYKNP